MGERQRLIESALTQLVRESTESKMSFVSHKDVCTAAGFGEDTLICIKAPSGTQLGEFCLEFIYVVSVCVEFVCVCCVHVFVC